MAERRRASSSRKRSRLGVLLRVARRAAICSKLLRKYARSCISWGYLRMIAHGGVTGGRAKSSIHRGDAETLRKQKTEGAEVAEAAERQSRNLREIHHGATEPWRKSKSKARPESTEMAEATERPAGAMGASTQESEGVPIDSGPVQTFYSYALSAR